MADERNDGGPAFPNFHHEGISMRDYFAAAAMQGALACEYSSLGNLAGKEFLSIVADAYRVADAMLKAREVCDG